VAFDSPSTNLFCPAATDIVTTSASVRRHNTCAAMLCIVIVIGIAVTARWIQEREAVVHESFAASRTATIERNLLAADIQLMQLFANADGAMLPALAELDGHDPCTVPAGALATFRQFAADAAASRLALDIWCRDGSNMLQPERPSAANDTHFAIHADADAGTRAKVVDSFRGMYVSTPAFDPATLEARIRLTRPVLGTDGALQGVVGVAIRLSALTDLLMPLRERASERIALYRNDRLLVAQYPAESAVGIADTPHDAIWRHYPSSAFGHFETPGRAGGADTLSMYFGLRPLPLVVVYTTEWWPISREALRIYWPVLVIAAAALIAAFVYAWISIRYANALSRANAELAQAKEHLQFEADERGIFIANMNHELRTPLNAIVGFAQILADATFGPSHPKYREYARDIASSGQHLQTLIGEIIDFAAIDRGHRNIAITRLDAAEAVAEAARLLRPIAGARGISIDTVGEDVWALGDLAAVRQILINLVTNAIKFSTPGGTVAIECRTEAETGLVAIRVADRGTGIAPAEMSSIGRPFFRTRAARLGAVSGAGLGLSISVALANQMGGRLTLKSDPGRGTTVTLLLPQAETVRMQTYANLQS
jgi:signal transduction histidine kinase